MPVGCVILTDAHAGAVAMGPVGFDIGCGYDERPFFRRSGATPKRREFNRAVMERVEMGQVDAAPGCAISKNASLTS